MADPQASEARLRAAVEAADLGPLLASLPQGLETPLGERGFGLSGGQARRLALARALLSGAPVLLLDEPTEGLDRASADRLLQALARLADGRRTVLVATHDTAVQDWADRVVRVVDGAVAEVSA
nr:ATP-binding cassette domain-containing protein [Alkalilimnicola ehrlichii]